MQTELQFKLHLAHFTSQPATWAVDWRCRRLIKKPSCNYSLECECECEYECKYVQYQFFWHNSLRRLRLGHKSADRHGRRLSDSRTPKLLAPMYVWANGLVVFLWRLLAAHKFNWNEHSAAKSPALTTFWAQAEPGQARLDPKCPANAFGRQLANWIPWQPGGKVNLQQP